MINLANLALLTHIGGLNGRLALSDGLGTTFDTTTYPFLRRPPTHVVIDSMQSVGYYHFSHLRLLNKSQVIHSSF